MVMTPLQNRIAAKIGSAGGSLTREAIENYQLGKLRETIELAGSRSVFYREALARRHKNINSLKDLQHLPFTTAEDLRRNPLHFLCVSQDEISRVVTLQSSGTTGEPKRLYFTREDQELTIDFFHIGMSTLVGPGDKVLILLPGKLPGSVGDLLVKGLQRLGARGIPHGLVTDPEHTLRVMREEEVDALVGIPTQVLSLARHRNKGGKDIPLRIKSVLLSTDYVPRAIARELENSWNCRVYSHYGMTEMGLGGGVECRSLAGYHLREADLYFEVINPVTGQPVPEGEEGEVVFTTLTRKGMPLIRYRTGDKARFIPEPCPCETVLKRMGLVTGRINGSCRVAGGLLTMRELDEALFPVEGLVDFEASLSRADGVDRLNIGVRMAGEVDDKTRIFLRKALETIPLIKHAVIQGNLEVNLDMLIPPTTPGICPERGGVSPFTSWGHSCPQGNAQASAGVSPYIVKRLIRDLRNLAD
ncbi:MAG: AMP-binding protein [Peptococcaceae bacterium]|nr:AMP-binding protein [Peptococcaceae bacterium]